MKANSCSRRSRGQFFEVEVLDDDVHALFAAADRRGQTRWLPSPGSRSSGTRPRPCCRRRPRPTSRSAAHSVPDLPTPRRPQIRRLVVPQRRIPRPRTTAARRPGKAHLGTPPASRGTTGEIVGTGSSTPQVMGDRFFQPATSSSTPRHTSGGNGFDPETREAGRRLGGIGRDTAEQGQALRLMAERIQMRPGMFHHGENPGGAAAWSVFRRAVGIAMTSVQRVEVAGQVRRVNRHATEARLLQVVHAGRTEGVEPGGGHGGMLRGQADRIGWVLLSYPMGRGGGRPPAAAAIPFRRNTRRFHNTGRVEETGASHLLPGMAFASCELIHVFHNTYTPLSADTDELAIHAHPVRLLQLQLAG